MQSGSLVHLQLVQVHPGLCEIGSNRDENQTLIQEQQQLMDKLKVNTDTETRGVGSSDAGRSTGTQIEPES